MSKCIILNLGSGNFEDGFPSLTVELREIHKSWPILRLKGSLPPVPEIPELYIKWKSLYDALAKKFRQRGNIPKVNKGGTKQISDIDFPHLCEQLKQSLNDWLNSPSFSKIEKKLCANLSPDEDVWIVVETDNQQVQKLPWHLWDFFTEYRHAEIAFSTKDSQQTKLPDSSINKVRILSILGNSQGINIDADRKKLSKIRDTKIEFLAEPKREEISEQLWTEGWDILFFAGHSETIANEKGKIYINRTDSLTIEQLKYSLRKAISNGLQLAIFNSCDGLGLAWELADLQIPQIIVMREPIPDLVAQEFLTYFLEGYTQGKSLYLAVREAREKLQDLEDKCHCASWLPIIYQNLAQIPLSWQQLRDKKITPESFLLPEPSLLIPSLIINGVIALLMIIIRFYGGLQFLELPAFDHLMRMRHLVVNEGVDTKILLVTITEEDLIYQNENKIRLDKNESISDQALDILLAKLNQYQPRVIGLDIYRENPINPQYINLIKNFQKDNFVGVCLIAKQETDGIGKPPSISNVQDNLGFTNFLVDDHNKLPKYVRRQLFGQPRNKKCETYLALSFQLAYHYLAKEPKLLNSGNNPDNLELDEFIVKKLGRRVEINAGGYKLPIQEIGGGQILLNYRITKKIAEEVHLREILSGLSDNQLSDLVKDKIVLIGTTAPESFQDQLLTPIDEKMPGVKIHAHQVSQILSTVLDNRHTLWWWPEEIEIIWITTWIFAGGSGFYYWRSLRYHLLNNIVVIIVLYGSCYIILLQGGWIPFVPSLIGLLLSGVTIPLYVLVIKNNLQTQFLQRIQNHENTR
ncbi:CHASE2 domain-containing protein [Anabaena cylindrica FACHB-243]|uniref:Chase2 sensor protein n=1 Tax=Anabaena cylindrica (strain ATCC 27899 / PCC 7122) TaxID=272123 RepID=K9ZQ78_ANACC|nr:MULTISPECIES: CHASE2 domain-containing protein [Anabaena]AFZ61378.1 putative Chase2 sensor protein [Anabaena cylindrica PCC 7122]MBD2420374.1 CHASE2 domain-containing protein [Anabaena cylindrica FACHB-243]MBY5281866.1 CHASE2 domain-containing protein [Anabaena sp. CCAP 1446/1C]MBY5306985.1 CHASE2 domain-containing protein [Anabaena sp. CCAP 1446/1C]MCM2406003.1 CHASE2 domain-containing protein [Anabaena sp. CCAP 1446/1C]